MPKITHNFYIELEQQLLVFKENIKIHFKIKNSLETDNSDKTINLFINNIIPSGSDLLQAYKAVLRWCEQVSTADEFAIVKDLFLKAHKQRFKNRIIRSQQKLERLYADLAHTRQNVMTNHNAEIMYLTNELKETTDRLQLLTLKAEEITGNAEKNKSAVDFSPNYSGDSYQKAVRAVKKAAKKADVSSVLLKETQSAQYCPVQWTTIDVLQRNKQETLASLNKNIREYVVELHAENRLTKFAKLFSPSRWLRWFAIRSYNKSMEHAVDPHEQYVQAEKWYEKYAVRFVKHQTSRFYTQCLQPFYENNQQDYFDAIQMVDKATQCVAECGVVIETASATHKQKVKALTEQVGTLQNKCSAIYHGIKEVVRVVNKIEKSAWGYWHNCARLVASKITALCHVVQEITDSPAVILARSIIKEINVLRRGSRIYEVQKLQLKQKMVAIREDPRAVKMISTLAEQVITNAIKYGGSGDNSNYLGTILTQAIIAEIGTSEQIQQLNREMPKILEKGKHAKQKQTEEKAKNYVTCLLGEIKTGLMNKKLEIWREAYKKHKQGSELVYDEKSEHMYRKAIKRHSHKAKKIHSSGVDILAKLVNEVMAAALEAHAVRSACQRASIVSENISVENMGIFVLIFGTMEQQRRWQRHLFPQIQSSRQMATFDVGRVTTTLVDVPILTI